MSLLNGKFQQLTDFSPFNMEGYWITCYLFSDKALMAYLSDLEWDRVASSPEQMSAQAIILIVLTIISKFDF